MAEIRITSDNLGAVIRGLERLRKPQLDQVLRGLGALQKLNVNERMKSRRSYQDRAYPASKRAQRDGGDTLYDTGNMMESFKADRFTDRSVSWGVPNSEIKKAVWAQEGTPEHRIEPKNKKALKFSTSYQWPGTRKKAVNIHYSKWANHPGTPPRPLFGISPSDAKILLESAARTTKEWIEKEGIDVG